MFLRHPDRVAAKLKWERSTHAVRRYIGHTGTYSFIVSDAASRKQSQCGRCRQKTEASTARASHSLHCPTARRLSMIPAMGDCMAQVLVQ